MRWAGLAGPRIRTTAAICQTWLERHHGGAEVELTFLFADVRGSTALAERLSPSDFTDLLGRFYEVAARVVIALEGLVDKFVGDEIVAFFTPAFAGEDHADAAIEAARALLEETGHRRVEGPWLPVGAGVHTGIAFVGSLGESGVTEFTALGDAVNTTARLASTARAGEILVTRAAAEAAHLSATGREQRHLEVRGRTEPIDVVVVAVGPRTEG